MFRTYFKASRHVRKRS